MRDRAAIDAELRRLASARRRAGGLGVELSAAEFDALLDERLGHVPADSRAHLPEPPAVPNLASPSSRRIRTGRGGLRWARLALPLSVLACIAVTVIVLTMLGHRRDSPPASEYTREPSASATEHQPGPALSPQGAQSLSDRVFVDTLRQVGVPVADSGGAVLSAHRLCDHLGQQSATDRDMTDAVRYVRATSAWNDAQSTDFVSASIISYCPQFRPEVSARIPPDLDRARSSLTDIDRDMRSIDARLRDIRDALPGALGGG